MLGECFRRRSARRCCFLTGRHGNSAINLKTGCALSLGGSPLKPDWYLLRNISSGDEKLAGSRRWRIRTADLLWKEFVCSPLKSDHFFYSDGKLRNNHLSFYPMQQLFLKLLYYALVWNFKSDGRADLVKRL